MNESAERVSSVSGSSTFAPLLEAIGGRALPDADRADLPTIVVARPTFDQTNNLTKHAASRIRVSRRKLLGPRVSIRENLHNRSSHKIARWPDDGLLAASIPLLICVIGGRADLCMGEYVLHCEKGSFILVPPGVPYHDMANLKVDSNRSSGAEYDLLWISGISATGGVQCWINHARAPIKSAQKSGEGAFIPDSRTGQYFHAFFNETVNAGDEGQSVSYRLSQSLLVATLCAIQQEVEANRCFYPGQRTIEARPDRSTAIGQAQAHMAAHLYKHLTIDTVAHLVYMSRSQFTRRFRAETGKSFSEFMTDLRIAEAKNLLRDTDWSVQAICGMVGLASSSHLRKLLREQEGLAPTELRRISRKAN